MTVGAIVDRVVRPLSGRTGATSARLDLHGAPYDAAVAGVPFLYATSDDRPLRRGTAPFNKAQQDTENEPGEQSLAGWWLRSQESFHKGAGALYQEDRVSSDPSERFRDSMGVDVWTPGQVTLLPATEQLLAGAETRLLAQGADGEVPVVFQASGTTLTRITETATATVAWGGATEILALEVYGGSYYAVSADGVYQGPVNGSAGSLLWDLSGLTFTNVFYRRRGGSALLLVGLDCYDLTDESVAPTLPSPFFSLIQADWVWTDAVEALADVRASGVSNGSSAIWTFTPVIAGGWTSTFAGGLPRGEQVLSLANYYNTFLVLGTNRGVRMAAYADDGQYTFGPLTWEAPAGAGPVRGVATVGRFVYAAAETALPDGTTGLVRIDPEAEVDTGHFAYANDLSSGLAATAGPVADLNGRAVFALEDFGSYIASDDAVVETGYLSTGRIRFRTLESKLFKHVRVRTDPMQGSVTVEVITDSDTVAPVTTYSVQGVSDLEEASLPLILGPQESIALRFTLARSATDSDAGPTLRSYQVKALPAPLRQRVFDLWVSCFDTETAKTGTRLGHQGHGLERLDALETAEESSDLVLYQDFASGASWLVQIDEIQFVQTAPPGKTSGWGGFLNIKMRTAG